MNMQYFFQKSDFNGSIIHVLHLVNETKHWTNLLSQIPGYEIVSCHLRLIITGTWKDFRSITVYLTTKNFSGLLFKSQGGTYLYTFFNDNSMISHLRPLYSTCMYSTHSLHQPTWRKTKTASEKKEGKEETMCKIDHIGYSFPFSKSTSLVIHQGRWFLCGFQTSRLLKPT